MNEAPQDSEAKRKAAVELANSYREMMSGFAWKHLNAVILKRLREESNDTIDAMDIKDLTVAHVAEARGIRRALDMINSELVSILEYR